MWSLLTTNSYASYTDLDCSTYKQVDVLNIRSETCTQYVICQLSVKLKLINSITVPVIT